MMALGGGEEKTRTHAAAAFGNFTYQVANNYTFSKCEQFLILFPIMLTITISERLSIKKTRNVNNSTFQHASGN